MKISSITFRGIPDNYSKIDNHVSRSAQPKAEDFQWLKEQGVTDVINFRTMFACAIDYDEAEVVKGLGLNYHTIPSVTKAPTEENINKFLGLVENISKNGGKAHIHCMAGADRTGMYSFIYKGIKGIGTFAENTAEWIARGHNTTRYPDLINWATDFVKKYKHK